LLEKKSHDKFKLNPSMLMSSLKAYILSFFGLLSFSRRKGMVRLKNEANHRVRLAVLFVVIVFIGVLMSFPEPSPESTSHALAKLEDSWIAEPGRMTKDYKKLLHLNNLKINIHPLSNDRMIVYAKPASEIIPSSIVLKLRQAESLIEGQVFRAIRQSDSVNFNIILSKKSNKLTLAFALEKGPATGEYVFSFLRDKGEK
jgi:hypothetical protein